MSGTFKGVNVPSGPDVFETHYIPAGDVLTQITLQPSYCQIWFRIDGTVYSSSPGTSTFEPGIMSDGANLQVDINSTHDVTANACAAFWLGFIPVA